MNEKARTIIFRFIKQCGTSVWTKQFLLVKSLPLQRVKFPGIP